MPTSLANLTVKDSSHELIIKSNDITIDGSSILGQNDFADKDLSNLSTTGQNILDSKLDTTQITNCITEISQDIKVELNNGILTIKSGSKFYVPNGFETDGTTPKFDIVTLTTDSHPMVGTFSGQSMAFYKSSGIFANNPISNILSGTTVPTGFTGMFYKTDTNILDYYANGTAEGSKFSLPLVLITENNSAFSSIDQVFNGFGYIGSTAFVLPGIKGLIPNGRNADGSLKNIEITSSQVWTRTWTNNPNYHDISLATTGIGLNTNTYNEEENFVYNVGGVKVTDRVVFGRMEYNSSSPWNITSLQVKTAFHAIDYNDFKEADDNNVKLTGNQTINDVKTYTSNIYINKNGNARYICKSTTYQKGTAPSDVQFGGVSFWDKNNVEMGSCYSYIDTSNNIGTALFVRSPVTGSTTSANLGMAYTSSGELYTFAPTPAVSSNNTNIATTAYVNNKFQVVSTLPASPDSNVFYFIPA